MVSSRKSSEAIGGRSSTTPPTQEARKVKGGSPLTNGNGNGNNRVLIAVLSALLGTVFGGGASWLAVGTRLATMEANFISMEKSLDRIDKNYEGLSDRMRDHERRHNASGD
jgi:hypothetical protein